ncbi:MAG: hypothetical protein AABM30_03400 [Actinomycetota bacterium]
MTITAEQVVNWLQQASEADLRAIGRPSTVERLLFAARDGMAAGDARVRELALEVQDVLRRYASERAPH